MIITTDNPLYYIINYYLMIVLYILSNLNAIESNSFKYGYTLVMLQADLNCCDIYQRLSLALL